MVLPLGTCINAFGVVCGASAGMLMGNRLPERIRTSVFQALGLCTLFLGMGMSLKSQNPLYVIGSIIIGVILGESMRLEDRISTLGETLKSSLRSRNQHFTDGFVTASILFCIGSMAILGPLNEGLTGDRSILLTKTLLDTFASMALGAAYGSGVLVSALSVLVYQGLITLFAEQIRPYLTDFVRLELEATGGITIIGIGCNLLGITQLRISNFLPALLVVVILCIAVTAITEYL